MVFLYFSYLKRLNWTKNPPLQSSLEFSDSLKYENSIEHLLVRSCKIHESVLYQAFFYLFFELSKNEEGLEFSFLDLSDLYKKEGREVHSHVFYIMVVSLIVLILSTVGF